MSSRQAKRYPREECTKALARALARVDATPERLCEYKEKINFFPFAEDWGTLRVRAHRIWAWGSHARGATECGDVDLVVDANLSFVDDVWFRKSSLQPGTQTIAMPSSNWSAVDYFSYWRHVDWKLLGAFRKPLDRASCTIYQGLRTVTDKLDTGLTRNEVMEHAVLVWEPGLDWRAALADIEVNPKAGRFPDSERRIRT